MFHIYFVDGATLPDEEVASVPHFFLTLSSTSLIFRLLFFLIDDAIEQASPLVIKLIILNYCVGSSRHYRTTLTTSTFQNNDQSTSKYAHCIIVCCDPIQASHLRIIAAVCIHCAQSNPNQMIWFYRTISSILMFCLVCFSSR